MTKLRSGKACGPDGIPAEFINYRTRELPISLGELFVKYISEKDVPTEVKAVYVLDTVRKEVKMNPISINKYL